MPNKIYTNNQPPEKEAQDLSSLLPFLSNPYSILQQFAYGEEDRKKIKNIWLSSDVDEKDIMTVKSSISQQDLMQLKQRGLINYVDSLGKKIQLTSSGKNLLKESILSDEETAYSFTKKASKDLFSKNSYDFGDEILVKLKNPEKYGVRYATVSKKQYNKRHKDCNIRPKSISEYNIATRKDNGSYKKISEYSDEDLIQILHLAKNIIKNHQIIRTSNKNIINVPINRIKSFSNFILNELNSRI